jgi:hypothetical protein
MNRRPLACLTGSSEAALTEPSRPRSWMGELVSDWREQEATNGTIFREMNEWTEEENDARYGVDRPIDDYLCECSDRWCTQQISLTRAEYEAIRAIPVRFAIALNHENPEIDRVLRENERFATIEKFFGVAAKIARATNPRR